MPLLADEEVAMNSIVANVLVRHADGAQTNISPMWSIGLLCGVGLLASLSMASLGFDVSAGFF
jgi:hypothetical protein